MCACTSCLIYGIARSFAPTIHTWEYCSLINDIISNFVRNVWCLFKLIFFFIRSSQIQIIAIEHCTKVRCPWLYLFFFFACLSSSLGIVLMKLKMLQRKCKNNNNSSSRKEKTGKHFLPLVTEFLYEFMFSSVNKATLGL